MNTRKKLFAPVLHPSTKGHYAKGLIRSTCIFLFDVYTIVTLQFIGTAVQKGDIQWIKTATLIFAIALVIFSVWKYFSHHLWWPALTYIKKHITKTSLQKFFALDCSIGEKIGTWRLSHIITTWIQNRGEILLHLQFSWVEFIIKFTFALYLVFSLWWLYGIWFLVYMIIWNIATIYINKHVIKIRKKRKNVEVWFSRDVVRNIMSKREILLGNMREQEHQKIDKVLHQKIQHDVHISKYLFFMFNIPILWVQAVIIILFIQTYISLEAETL